MADFSADGFVKALPCQALADGQRELVEISEQLVLIFRIGEQFFCMDDICTHDGGTLADGDHEGFEISCPRHGARFDIRTGAALCMPATQPTKVHECRVADGYIWVQLSH